MPQNRYYLDEETFKKNVIYYLENTEFSHLVKVMRKKEGGEIELINGRGYLAIAEILKIGKKRAEIKIKSLKKVPSSKNRDILVQAIIKPTKLEFLLEKSSELGVHEFWFFESKNSEKNLNFSKNRKARLENILISAIKQSGNLFLPKVKFFKDLFDIGKIRGDIFFGSTKKNAPLFMKVFKKSNKNNYFFIGPEKGFSLAELQYLEKDLKAIPVKLNENILRAETAGIVAISLLKHFQI